MKKFIGVLTILLMTAGISLAGTIYIWTDENGVKKFSDQPPPEGVEAYETVEGEISKPDQGRRPGFERMVRDVERRNQEQNAKAKTEAKSRAEEQKRKQKAEKNAPLLAERARLKKQIADLQNRGLSSTFTKGMRDNQIKERREQIEALNRKIDAD